MEICDSREGVVASAQVGSNLRRAKDCIVDVDGVKVHDEVIVEDLVDSCFD